MKRLIVILLGLCISFSLFGCTGGQKSLGSFKEISYDTCEAMFESDVTFVLVISQTECSNCKEYKEMLTSFTKENKVNIVYIEADKDLDAFQTLLEKRFPKVEESPSTLMVVNGIVREVVSGKLVEEQLEVLLTRNRIAYGSVSELSYEKAAQWFESEKEFVRVVSQTSCHVCASYKENLVDYVTELGVDFVYIEADRDFDTFQNKLWDVYFPEVEETPATCIVKGGEVVDSVVGDLSFEQVKKLLSRNGVVYE